MSVRNLEYLFKPASVAVIGASNRPYSVGATVMGNLLGGGYEGPIMPVNPNHGSVLGVLAYPDIGSLPVVPDLGVICTPPDTVPGLIDQLGRRGTRAAVVLTAGLTREDGNGGKSLWQQMLDAARPHMLRVLGPNCVGLLVPGHGLNASFVAGQAPEGQLAFVSQSGALATAVLDWSRSRGIGFSHFISLGEAADVDFGDVLDYLGGDADTSAILLYIESVKHARKFMSAARAAARNKPVIVVKAGRNEEGAAAAASHTGALTGADDVYDAAIRRAGMLRVDNIDDLFNAAETLGRARPPKGSRLLIVTNGGGAGVMAADALADSIGTLPALEEGTIGRLDEVLPINWSRRNPVDIVGDATAERYLAALEILVGERNYDSLLLIHAPTAIVPTDDLAGELVPWLARQKRSILTCWLGGKAAAGARSRCNDAGIPTYETPEDAVNAFLQLADYRRNQEALIQTPPSIPRDGPANRDSARLIVQGILADGREELSEPQAKSILAAYGIPVVETRVATDVDEAVNHAGNIGYPVALKILSPDISHKSDVGGVMLDLEDADSVRKAGVEMLQRVKAHNADARVTGFTVQAMARRPGAFELIAGANEDPVFGPILLFGEGGTAVEVIADRAIGLPPLNAVLARDMMERTRIFRLLSGYRDRKAVDLDAIARVLVRVGQLVTDIPEIAELDINPLVADANGVLALDARMRVRHAKGRAADRLAIRPYPSELEERAALDGRSIVLRPIRPEDEPRHIDFLHRLSPEDIRFRFFSSVRDLPHSQMARFTQIDYDREMAFIAVDDESARTPETLGVVRIVTDPDNIQSEFAIVVRSDLKGHGLGGRLLDKMIDYCRKRGTQRIIGQVLRDNRAMQALAESRGFHRKETEEREYAEVVLDLTDESATER